MNEIRNILNKIDPLLEESNKNDIMDALSDFTDLVKKILSKRAEKTYRKSGEPWDPRINELEQEYLNSLKITENPNWFQYSYMRQGNPIVIAYVAKQPNNNIEVGDVIPPGIDKKQKPDIKRTPITNVFNLDTDINDIS